MALHHFNEAERLGVEFRPEDIGFEFSIEKLLEFSSDEFVEKSIRDGSFYRQMKNGRLGRVPQAA